MSEEKTEPRTSKLKQFFAKFKKIKGFEIAIVIILVSVMLLIALSTFSGNKKETKTTSQSEESLEAYAQALESKLNDVLSKIEGVGSVSSMITFEGGFEQKLAYTSDNSQTTGEKDGSSSSNSTSSQSIVYTVKDGVETPMVLTTQNPKIAGVVVVSSGAKDVNVKLDIIRAVSTLLNVDVSCIEVLVGK